MGNKLEITRGNESPAGILKGFGGSGPHGQSIGLTRDFAVLDGKPWIGVIGEFHYTRYPRRHWKEELAKVGCGGVDIVSTYVFWIHHEEVEGSFDWSGDRDLRGFILACGEAGLRAIVRIGPFAHGEARNGGFPDWLYGRPFPLRSNDPRYLEYVRKLYAEIGRQLDGLFFKDGGPVIGIQLENEFMHAAAPWEAVPRLSTELVTGGSGGAEHMRVLKRLAAEAGMIVPLYTSTGWGGAPILEEEILPLYGGYAFRPWNISASTPVHSPTPEYVFRSFRGGAVRDEIFDPPYDPASLPFACCEMGSGMQSWYRYRFTVPPESVEAMAVVKLAGGCCLPGYYMFHGGSNPAGKGCFLNEHVVPRISYDFQAPLGEYGQVRESYRRLRRLHLFLRDFGGVLAPMRVFLPPDPASLPADVDTLRYCARSSGDSGFLFLNNYQDHAATKDHPNVSIQLDLPSSAIRIPGSGGFTLKSGSCAIMPFNLDLGGIRLEYSTAQPIARLEADGGLHYFFFEHEGIPAEYLFPGREGGTLLRPGTGITRSFSIGGGTGRRVTVHTLTEKQSIGFSRLKVWGRERVIISAADVFALDNTLCLRTLGTSAPRIDFLAFPAPDSALTANGKRIETASLDGFASCTIPLDAKRIALDFTRCGAADAEVRLPPGAFDGVREIYLSIAYDGDVGNAFLNGRLIADDFCGGPPWEIGLSRFRPEVEEAPIMLHVIPRRKGEAVVRESAMASMDGLRGNGVVEIVSAVAVPEYEVTVRVRAI